MAEPKYTSTWYYRTLFQSKPVEPARILEEPPTVGQTVISATQIAEEETPENSVDLPEQAVEEPLPADNSRDIVLEDGPADDTVLPGPADESVQLDESNPADNVPDSPSF